MTTQLIPVVSDQIDGQPVLAVDARELHAFMNNGTRFNDWFVRRVQEFGFIQGVDFREILKKEYNPNRLGGQMTIKEYRLTLDMAKELAMVERTEKGRMVRRYFIECERLARGQQEDIAQLRLQRDTLWAWLLEVKPQIGKIARCWQVGLTQQETARALQWGPKRVRKTQRRLASIHLLPQPESRQMALFGG